MSKFEKLYPDGVPFEITNNLEKHPSIEKSDTEIIQFQMQFVNEIDVIPVGFELIYKPPLDHPDLLDESKPIGKKYKKAKELCKEAKVLSIDNKIKSPKRKLKKINKTSKV